MLVLGVNASESFEQLGSDPWTKPNSFQNGHMYWPKIWTNLYYLYIILEISRTLLHLFKLMIYNVSFQIS